ncbi:hypothetical protein ACFX13_040530 [Malus domestica]
MYIHQQQASQKEVIQAQVTASKPNSSNHWTRVFPAPNQPHSSEAQLCFSSTFKNDVVCCSGESRGMSGSSNSNSGSPALSPTNSSRSSSRQAHHGPRTGPQRRQQHEQPHPLNSSSSSPKASVLSDQADPFNTIWLSDRFFTGGATSVVSEPLQFHHPQEKTLRYFPLSSGKKNCYIIPNLPSGRYYICTFTVYDNYDGRSHSPSFDVSVEGTVVFSWRSPCSEDLARTGAYSDLLAFVADSEADICFYSIATDPPVIGSLQLIRVDPDSYDAGSIKKKKLHSRKLRPEDIDTSRAVYKIDKNHLGSDVAGETAAALAAASIVFRSRDPAYSRFLLNRAVRVFEFADRHRGAYSASLHHAVCPFLLRRERLPG